MKHGIKKSALLEKLERSGATKEERLIVTAKGAHPAVRKFLVYALVIALSLSPLIDSPQFKAAVVACLGTTLLFLCFDIYNELCTRLSAIDANVGSPHPPTWGNYAEAQGAIMQHVTSVLEKGDDLHIEIIGVSARFSWRMVEEDFGPLLKEYSQSKITVDVAVSARATLEAWHLDRWIGDLERTIKGMDFFVREENPEEVASGRLVVTRYNYDNIPQWHGVLINKETLFMGRTEWIPRTGDFDTMKVGQCQYRKFELMDRYGGAARIKMFDNWMDRFRRRHSELVALQELSMGDSPVAEVRPAEVPVAEVRPLHLLVKP